MTKSQSVEEAIEAFKRRDIEEYFSRCNREQKLGLLRFYPGGLHTIPNDKLTTIMELLRRTLAN